MFARLARAVHARPRHIAVVGGVLFGLAGVAGGSVADSLKPFGFDDPDSESVIARERLTEGTGREAQPGLIALIEHGGPIDSAAGRRKVNRVARTLERDPDVVRVVTTLDRGDPAMVSNDGRATYVLGFMREIDDAAHDDVVHRIEAALDRQPDVRLGGSAPAIVAVNETVESDLQRAELIAFPILFLLSLWVFRGLVAALLPLMVGAISIVLAFAGIRIVAEQTEISIFALNLTIGLGLGLAIDYSLFIVSRYREEIARAGPGLAALQRTLTTAGRTVLFSSITVAASLASLLIFPQRFLYSMGVGGVLVALCSAAVALILLPAVLAMLGERVNALAPRRWRQANGGGPAEAGHERRGAWYRLSHFVMRRPVPIAIAAAVPLIAIGAAFTGIRFTAADESVLPKSAEPRQVADTIQQRFPPNRTTPVIVQIDAPRTAEAAARLREYGERLAGVEGAVEVRAPRPVGPGLWRADVISSAGGLAERSQDLARSVREVPAPYPTRVGGSAAEFVDQKASLADHIPLAVAIVVAATLIVLFLMTGSVVLPLKALVMNALTISAAFGLLVLIFQHGRLEGLLGYTQPDGLDASMPMLLFAVVFGLSTDYGVFLLSRIKEARDAGLDNKEAVAIGLERTGRIVTAAALLFCVAIGAFATSQIVFIKENGVGTAFAVLVDATIIRAFLVPSLMAMLGRWNWWSPAPLRRLHARIGLSET